jgi:hypothetical protein
MELGAEASAMKQKAATPVQEALYQEICTVLKKYEDRGLVQPIEMLAVMANLVGKQIALLDQTKFTPDEAMQVVCANIEFGNQLIIGDLLGKTAGTT